MAKGRSEDQRRRARERKKRKQAERHRERQRQEQANTLEARVIRAAVWPLRECLIIENWQEISAASIMLSRDRPGGGVTAAMFFADLGCLGIKSALAHEYTGPYDYEQDRDHLIGDSVMTPCEPAFALAVLETARTYAASLGFHPDPDYRTAVRLFGDLAPDAGGTEIVCGRDGKPFYVSGPNDNFAAIMGYLRRKCGDHGFTFIVGGPGTI